jgi:hypothetical protein
MQGLAGNMGACTAAWIKGLQRQDPRASPPPEGRWRVRARLKADAADHRLSAGAPSINGAAPTPALRLGPIEAIGRHRSGRATGTRKPIYGH